MKLKPDFVPSTVESAARKIADSVSEDERQAIRDDPEPLLTDAHITGGLSIRNQWSLRERDGPLKRAAATKYGIAHADDISGPIMSWAFAMIRGEEFDPSDHCKQCHEHWSRYGTDALTAGGYRW